MKRFLQYAYIFSVCMCATIFFAVSNVYADGELDPSFQYQWDKYDDITKIDVQSDGRAVIIGYIHIDSVGDVNVARINTNGSIDETFVYGVIGGYQSEVQDVYVQSDGKIIVSGFFETYNGENAHGVVRLNSDGSIDHSFELTDQVEGGDHGVYGDFWRIAVQPDGKILLVGKFSIPTFGQDVMNIVRLNTDGSLDATFNPGTYLVDYYPGARLLLLQPDGKIISGTGYFDKLVRFNSDGSVDAGFDNDSIGQIWDGVIQSDGKVTVIGWGVRRLNLDGFYDDDFSHVTFDNDVKSIAMQNDGKFLVGGNFNESNGTLLEHIVRVNVDGSLDTDFSSNSGHLSNINSIVLQPDGNAFVAGFGGVERIILANSFNEDNVDSNANLSLSVSENLTLDCGNSIDLDKNSLLTAGSPVANTTTCTVTTNDQDGYTLSLTNDRGANNTLYHATNNTTQDGQIQDKTPWNNTTPNAQVWADTGLGFGILSSTATKNETWWGTANECNDTTQLYAGIPPTDTSIMQHETYSNTQTDTMICYKLDIPSTQISGEYTGSVMYTAAGRP